MRSVKYLIAAGAASLLSTTAFAADMPSIMPPPPAYAPPQPCCDFGGWYLRGDVGMTNQSIKSLTNTDPASAAFTSTGMGFDSSPLWDIGVGYQFNNWFRVDVTGQYRGRANFHGTQFAPVGVFGPTYAQNDNYSASKSETVIMANGYVDLGTWWCVTPFIGGGIGASYNRISGFRDDGVIYNAGVLNNSVTFASDAGKWNFAWALHAGVGYKVTPNVTIELAYSYMNLGDATTGTNTNFAGSPVAQNPWTMHDITSHDLKLGVRWNFDQPPPPMMPAPLIRKG